MRLISALPRSRRGLFILADRLREPPFIVESQSEPVRARTIVNLNGAYKWTLLRNRKRAAATLQKANRAIRAIGDGKPFLIVYYGSDHAGGWQTLDRPLRTITTLDRFAVVKPSRGGSVSENVASARVAGSNGNAGIHEVRRWNTERQDQDDRKRRVSHQ